jgi:predicted component of type VI protein secretion system
MGDQEKQAAQRSGATMESSEFSSLLKNQFKPKSTRAQQAVEDAVQTLAEQALRHTTLVSDDAIGTIDAIVAAIDKKLTEQVNQIMHHEEFQKLEGAWRGLHHLVNNTETDEMLKIRVMNISKNDLHKTLKKFKGTAWDQSPLFKQIYEQEYGQFGGEPYGCLVGDYYFDHSPPDVELLGEMSQICAAAHTPFISAAAPTLMNMDSWQELADPRDLTKIFTTPEYACGARCANPRTRGTSAWPCRASWPGCPTAPRPAPSRSSTSRRRPTARTTTGTRGPTRPTPWPSTSTRPSSSTAGARASAASSPAGPWRACRPTPSPPTTAAWT